MQSIVRASAAFNTYFSNSTVEVSAAILARRAAGCDASAGDSPEIFQSNSCRSKAPQTFGSDPGLPSTLLRQFSTWFWYSRSESVKGRCIVRA